MTSSEARQYESEGHSPYDLYGALRQLKRISYSIFNKAQPSMHIVRRHFLLGNLSQ